MMIFKTKCKYEASGTIKPKWLYQHTCIHASSTLNNSVT